MSKPSNGGQAFPRAGFSGPRGFGTPENGMSLRDFFAGQAMQARLTGMNMARLDIRHEIAADAYAIADAMLAESAKGGDA